MRGSEVLFAGGLFCAALGAGLSQLVIIGLVALVFYPLGCILLLLAGTQAQSDGDVSFGLRASGWVLYVVGVLALLALAGHSSSLLFRGAMAVRHSGSEQWGAHTEEWGLLGLLSLAPAMVIPLGLRLRTAWPWRRCAAWGVAAWCALPATVMIFLILSRMWPIYTY